MTARPSFEHLLRLSDRTGVFEHALGAAPRREHGYCVDDVARALLVVVREPQPPAAVAALGERCLRFLASAQAPDGRFHNRLSPSGAWTDAPAVGDWWGRALWALGVAAVNHPQPAARRLALAGFELGATRRSPFARSMAFAVLGAAEIASAQPEHASSRALLVSGAAAIGRPRRDSAWPWPEARLTYANAALPEALIAAGSVLGDDRLLDDGLVLLDWLINTETRSGHLSPTAVGGWGPGEHRAVFDQQPIEAAAIADACARALACTGDGRWLAGLNLAIGWFEGDNDAATALLDPFSGGGYDGLTRTGANTNQGAESTISLISATQHSARRSVAIP